MHDYNLGFISNEDIFEHVKNTVRLYRVSIDLKEFNANIIDPIKLTFDSKVYGKSLREVIETECLRQIDKSNQNHIGYFHQNLFRYAPGWTVPPKGFDVVNEERHIFAELKNKHNTMNSRAALSVYSFMQNKILHDDKAVCMLVEVISKKSQNTKWHFGSYSHDNIRKVSIDRFYEIVFSDKDAFRKLYEVLPRIISDALKDEAMGSIQNSVHEQLNGISPNLLESLYLLAFRTYEGFDHLHIKE